MTDFTVVVPARFASTRLPGKPLLDIAGKPMIAHVWERAQEAGAGRVIVATDDERIRAACEQFGAEVFMTAKDHASGTDRINEVVAGLSANDDDVFVNVQGDEPLMPPENIRQVAELAALAGTDIATLHVPVTLREEFLDPNVVKLVADAEGRALYFSRAPIPWNRNGERDENGWPTAFEGAVRHLGIYAYRTNALRRFAAAPSCVLEDMESLEQLRALWMGMTIRTSIAARIPPRGVDTPEDLVALRGLFSV
ncbi:MAG TPA: 3-deoxy-manno-octulosonate cytidylyltransferase [Gammaproteobacteria bacterium]